MFLDDVIDDVGGRVVDAACFLDLGLFFDFCPMSFGETDDFAEELLVDLAENICRENGEFVGLIGVVEALDYVP